MSTDLKRDKLLFDIFWLKDESLEDSANLAALDTIAAEIVEDLQAALAQFAAIAQPGPRGLKRLRNTASPPHGCGGSLVDTVSLCRTRGLRSL
jgi:hypothetical protein